MVFLKQIKIVLSHDGVKGQGKFFSLPLLLHVLLDEFRLIDESPARASIALGQRTHAEFYDLALLLSQRLSKRNR